MKAISLVKFFTLVGFLVLGVLSKGLTAETKTGDTKQACIAKIYRTEKVKCNSRVTEVEIEACVKRARNDADDHPDCADKLTIEEVKDGKTECKSLLKEYDDSMDKTSEECGRVGTGFDDSEKVGNEKCRETAKRCKKGLGAFGSYDDDSESVAGASVNLFRVVGQMQMGNNGGDPNAMNGCLINDDEKGETKEERVNNEITTLREKIADMKDKATEADKTFNEKKQDVDKEMLEIEKDADKEKFDKQTENQKETGRIQQAIMASEKKRKNNIIKIAEIHPKIAFLAFTQQELIISTTDSAITSACDEGATAELKQKIDGTVDPKTGKTVKPKFSLRESAKIKEKFRRKRAECFALAGVKRQKEIKTILDQKRMFESSIANLESENADEAKAIENEIKQMEELKKISDEGEAKAIEAKSKKLNSLNTSIIEMDRHIAEKKRSYAEKSKAYEDKIDKLRQDKLNVTSKFNSVSKAVESSGRKASVFVGQCCKNSDQSQNHEQCGRVISSDPDVTSGAKAYKKSTKKIKSGTSN